MCGIAGFIIADDDIGKLNTERMTLLLAHMMKARGTDATGVCIVTHKGRVTNRKESKAADLFLAGRKGLGQNAQTCLIHTRHATQGPPSNPLNNHPIAYGDIIGIHNGMVMNDDDIFEHHKWPRNARVDSEAIFATIHHSANLHEGLAGIDASWAIAWINQAADPRTLWLARGRSSPLFYGRTKGGSTIFASTEAAVSSAFAAGGVTLEGDPKQYITEAPQGFLACIDVEGEMETFPVFDHTGLKSISTRPSRQYGSGAWGGMDAWENASWRTDTKTAPAKEIATYTPSEGQERRRFSQALGWITETYSLGKWEVDDVLLDDLEREVEADAAYFRTDEQSVTSKAAQVGDRIKLTVKESFMTPDTIDLYGTVMGVTDGSEALIDWDATYVSLSAPYHVIGSLNQIGA